MRTLTFPEVVTSEDSSAADEPLVRSTSAKPEAETKSGIGLHNVKRRLDRNYPGEYSLTVEQNNDRYHVQLKIIPD